MFRSPRATATNQMPIYMDRHDAEGATLEGCASAHKKDLAIQGKYGVRFMTYWVDEVRSKAFCLVDAPNKDALQKAHDEAHGGVANEIIEVDPAVVEAFLGRAMDPPPTGGRGRAQPAQKQRGLTRRLRDHVFSREALSRPKALISRSRYTKSFWSDV